MLFSSTRESARPTLNGPFGIKKHRFKTKKRPSISSKLALLAALAWSDPGPYLRGPTPDPI